jgi:hypothetical protein
VCNDAKVAKPVNGDGSDAALEVERGGLGAAEAARSGD